MYLSFMLIWCLEQYWQTETKDQLQQIPYPLACVLHFLTCSRFLIILLVFILHEEREIWKVTFGLSKIVAALNGNTQSSAAYILDLTVKSVPASRNRVIKTCFYFILFYFLFFLFSYIITWGEMIFRRRAYTASREICPKGQKCPPRRIGYKMEF